MRKESNMLFLVMSLLYWTQTEGGCSGATVSISEDALSKLLTVVKSGEGFNLSCEFTCLRPRLVAQLWKDSGHEDGVPLVNITSTHPNVILTLSISSATKADTGYYYCMTQPPDAISPQVFIQIADDLTTSALTTPSTPQHDSTQQYSNAAVLLGQMWYWFLLAKTTIFLLSLATLTVKYRRR